MISGGEEVRNQVIALITSDFSTSGKEFYNQPRVIALITSDFRCQLHFFDHTTSDGPGAFTFRVYHARFRQSMVTKSTRHEGSGGRHDNQSRGQLWKGWNHHAQ